MNTETERTYVVQGMTCGHCKLSVTEEVGELAGVSAVDVDLPSGRVTVRGTAIDDDAVRGAVDAAGYQVVS